MNFLLKFCKRIYEKFREALFLSGLVFYAAAALWCCGAIHFQPVLPSPLITVPLTILYFGAVILSILFRRKFPAGVWTGAGITALIIVLWFTCMRPSDNRDWQPSCARIPKVAFHPGNRTVTVENIRDFHYRSVSDFDIRYLTQTYPLDGVRAVDYSIVHWDGMELIGHVILSFTFDDGRHLAFSAETRVAKNSPAGLLPGIYRQYEIIFILATEEDVFQLRTNHRHEDVFLYPTTTSREQASILLADLLRRSAELKTHPRFYNTLTFNCMSSLFPSIRKIKPTFRGTFEMLFNGVSDRMAYRSGWLTPGRPGESFGDYKKRHYANQYVDKLADPPDYSARIRSGF